MHSHTATVVGRTKLLVCGGSKGDVATSEVTILNTDNMKWMTPQVRGIARQGRTLCWVGRMWRDSPLTP